MKEKNKAWILIILVIIAVLLIGKVTTIKWYHFIWYPLIFSVGYFSSEIIGIFRFKTK